MTVRHYRLRALAIVAVLAAACGGGVSQTKLGPVYHAGKAIEGATATGVNKLEYARLVQSFVTEIGIARDQHPNEAEARVLENYTTAAAIYRDGLTIWNTRGWTPEVEPLRVKYGITRETSTEAELSSVWDQAGVWMAAGHKAYNQ